MAIRTVVTRGYGNGTFDGTIALIVTRGYLALVPAPVIVLPRPVGDTGFVKIRRIHSGSAHLEIGVDTQAAGHVIAHGTAHIEIVPTTQADGRIFLRHGAAHVELSAVGHAAGWVIKNTDVDDWVLLLMLDRMS